MKLRLLELTLLLGLAALGTTGCVVLVAGAAAGGGVSYVANELRVNEPVNIDKAWSAARHALDDVRYIMLSEHADATYAIWKGRNALDQPVVVTLKRLSDKATEIRIRVGTVSTAQNRAAADLVYSKLKARL